MKPLVTLAVPTLNRTTYLREALTSVLAQDYPNLDILVSDNGSHDETPEFARSIVNGDPRVRFRRNDTTVPVYDHFNQLVQEVRGEFFLVVCDDDQITPSFVSEAVAVATRHGGVNVVVPLNVTMDQQGNVLKEYGQPDNELVDGVDFVNHWLYERTPPYFACLATMLLRTETVRHFGGYPPFARGQSIDNMLFLQCALTGPVGFAHRAIFKWRIYPESFGTTATPQHLAQSGREAVAFVRREPRTVEALAALPPAERHEIVHGVRLLSARAFLYNLAFYDNPGACIRQVFIYPFDTVFLRIVLRHYAWWLRGFVWRRSEPPDTVQQSASALPRE
jgi:glycosyltransferase involved in cell wall biosynthesis